MDQPVSGECDAAFARVRSAFSDGFATLGELGAGLCVYVAGRKVVDLWGGYADVARTRPWSGDSVVNVFSAVKALTTVCALHLMEAQRFTPETRVAELWPEFAAHGKADIRVRDLLAHRSGVAALHGDVAPGAALAWEPMIAALADEEPWWAPGTAHGYHAITFGWLVGEVVRRASGATVRQCWLELAGELANDFDLGWHAALERVAEVAPTRSSFAPDDPFVARLMDPTSVSARALLGPSQLATPGLCNRAEWRAAELPASNGHASARGLARFYARLLPGPAPLVAAETIARASTPCSEGPDAVLVHESRFGLGFMLPSPLRPFSPNPAAFGHSGAGGSLGFADRDAQIAFAYVVNQPIATSLGGDPRWQPLMRAVYASL